MSVNAKIHYMGVYGSGVSYDYTDNITTSNDEGVFFETSIQNGATIQAYTILDHPTIKLNDVDVVIGATVTDKNAIVLYLRRKKTDLGLSDSNVDEIGQFLNSFPLCYRNIYSFGQANIVDAYVSGVLSGNGLPYGTQLSNTYGTTGDSYTWSQTKYRDNDLTDTEPILPLTLWHLMKYAADNDLFSFSTDLLDKINELVVPIKEDKSAHFDVYINAFKSNPLLGGYETNSITVRWDNTLVDQSKTESTEYKYQPNNSVVHIGVTNKLERKNIKGVADVLYGELEYKIAANRLFEVAGTDSKYMEIISSLVPAFIDGDAYLTLSLTFDGQLTNINDICVAQIPMNSTTKDVSHLKTLQGEKGSTVTLHYVTGDGEIPDIDPDRAGWGFPDLPDDDDEQKTDPNESDVTTNPGTNSNIGLLTTSYAMTESMLQSMGHILWSDSFMDNIQLVNNSPIENIISVKSFPFTISGGTSSNVKLGNVSMDGINGNKIGSTYSPVKTIGKFTVPKKFNDGIHNFLDFSPFTKITCHLPYIGFKELTLNEYMGKEITLKYIYDIITGVCTACFYCDGIEFEKFSGNIAIDIPVSASNRAQVQASYVQTGLNAIPSIVSGLMTGSVGSALLGAANAGMNMLMAQYHTQTSGSPSPSCDGFDEQTAYIIVDRPVYYEPSSYPHDFGYPCNLSLKLSSCKGFTQCNNVDVKGVVCTEEERNELKQILDSGVYL